MAKPRQRDHLFAPATGGISLLTVFAVLCLTVFALLTLSTVQADLRLADLSAQAVSGYYQADVQAQTILARLRRGDDPGDTAFDVEIVGDEQTPAALDRSYLIYSYTCPISETQELSVSVRMDDDRYTILRWQAVSTLDWQADENIEVWDGLS